MLVVQCLLPRLRLYRLTHNLFWRILQQIYVKRVYNSNSISCSSKDYENNICSVMYWLINAARCITRAILAKKILNVKVVKINIINYYHHHHRQVCKNNHHYHHSHLVYLQYSKCNTHKHL